MGSLNTQNWFSLCLELLKIVGPAFLTFKGATTGIELSPETFIVGGASSYALLVENGILSQPTLPNKTSAKSKRKK